MMRRFDRRDVLKMGTAAGAGMAFGGGGRGTAAQEMRQLSVLTTGTPDPRPPGTGDYGNDMLDLWKSDHATEVTYEMRPLFEVDDASRAAFDTGVYVHDVYYNSAMIPPFSPYLLELGSRLPEDLIADLAPSQGEPVSWRGQQYGVMPTLTLMILVYNRTIFESYGLPGPPATWDELKEYAAEINPGFPMGLMMPYGARAGIGGVASIWSAFLQQAGGRMYDDDGTPVFNDAPGVDALQFMIDLMPSTTGDSLTNVDMLDLSHRMAHDSAGMMFTFPAFWEVLNQGAPPGEGKIVPAVMPTGPENNATIAMADSWTIATTSPDPDLALQLIDFYLSPEVQRRQWTDIGWLPARLSVLEDPAVQESTPVAAAIREQANAPFASFVTDNFMAVTDVIGLEIQRALRGEQTAAQALTVAEEAIRPLLG